MNPEGSIGREKEKRRVGRRKGMYERRKEGGKEQEEEAS